LRVPLGVPDTARGTTALRRITGVRAVPPLIEEAPEPNRSVALRDRRYRRSLALADALSALVPLVVSAYLLGADNLSLRILLGLPLVVVACKLSGLYDRDELRVRKTTIDEEPRALRARDDLHDGRMDAGLGRRLRRAGQGPVPAAVVLLFGFSLTFRRIARSYAASTVTEERVLLICDAATYARVQHKLEAGDIHANLIGRMSLQRVSDLAPMSGPSTRPRWES
jgi:hypothetical protein